MIADRIQRLWQEIEPYYDMDERRELLSTVFANAVCYGVIYTVKVQSDKRFDAMFDLALHREMRELYQASRPYLDNPSADRQRRLYFKGEELLYPVRQKSIDELAAKVDSDLAKFFLLIQGGAGDE